MKISVNNLIFLALFTLLSCKGGNSFNSSELTSKREFWQKSRAGTNLFDSKAIVESLIPAKNYGIEFIRLTPSKWKSSYNKIKNSQFLIGDTNNYSSLIEEDLKELKAYLREAESAGLKVVLTFLSLPHHKWSQHNEGVQERGIFEDFKKQEKAIKFWRDIAGELKDSKAIVAYNILNEPSPERASPYKLQDWTQEEAYREFMKKTENTPQDLNLFYKKVIKAIREVDASTPIVLDSSFYANPWALTFLKAQDDDNVLYSFHMYEPFKFTNFRTTKDYSYPGIVPTGEGGDLIIEWNRDYMREFFSRVEAWREREQIKAEQILVGEFGASRKAKGVDKYFDDLLSSFRENKWHWAFYAFREDGWDVMDYELGSKAASADYWNARERGLIPEYPKKPSKLFSIILKHIRDGKE